MVILPRPKIEIDETASPNEGEGEADAETGLVADGDDASVSPDRGTTLAWG